MGDYNDPFMRNRDAAVQGRTKAQNRANVLQLKLIGQSHPTGLTNNLLKLFEARPPLEYKPPPEKKKPLPYTGMAQFVTHFASPDDPEYAPPVKKAETPAERRARIQKIRLEKGAAKAAEELEQYDPHKDPNVTGDPYKTLFVARLNYETTEHMIKREFEAYGPIKRIPVKGFSIKNSEVLSWAFCNSRKPGRNCAPINSECWVLHSTAEYAASVIARSGLWKPSNDTLAKVAEELFQEFVASGLNIPSPFFVKAHIWGSAFPAVAIGGEDKCLWDEKKRSAICGDLCVSPNIEGAFLSGMRAASKFLRDSSCLL